MVEAVADRPVVGTADTEDIAGMAILALQEENTARVVCCGDLAGLGWNSVGLVEVVPCPYLPFILFIFSARMRVRRIPQTCGRLTVGFPHASRCPACPVNRYEVGASAEDPLL